MSYQSGARYAGDMLSADAYGILAGDATSTLIDVRTQRRNGTMSACPISLPSARPRFSWSGRHFRPCRSTKDLLHGFRPLETAGVKRGAPLVFICRSGVRSRHAAIAMTGAGWAPCFNVSDGFEGPLDPWRHRSVIGGWKAGGLPWAQT